MPMMISDPRDTATKKTWSSDSTVSPAMIAAVYPASEAA